MNTSEPQGQGWNLFVRELEGILSHHGLRLTQLDDRAGIHREKVRRLQKSREAPGSFPTLNPGEMSMVIEACQLTVDEELWLRAALIATAVEAMLMDRVRPDDALKAAEQILPVIEAALRAHVDEAYGIGSFKRCAGEPPRLDDTATPIDLQAEEALEAFDRATLALNLSRDVASATERLRSLRQARDGFRAARDLLEEAGPVLRATEAWSFWHQEATSSEQAAAARITELEGMEGRTHRW